MSAAAASGLRVFSYGRVSSDRQAREGASIETQGARNEQFAVMQKLEIVPIDGRLHTFDEGESGKDLERPGIADVLGRLDRGEADGLLVFALKRLTRSVADWSYLMGRHFHPRARRPRELFSSSDLVDTRLATGRLYLNILVSVSEWERESGGEQTAAVLRHVQKRGVHLGQAPFGYRRFANPACAGLERCACGACGGLEKEPAEQAIIAGMRERMAALGSMAAVARELNAAGTLGRLGGAWTAKSVSRVLERRPDGKAVAA
jgi:DNA invertase Pin-like site-specific DNA recombinase